MSALRTLADIEAAGRRRAQNEPPLTEAQIDRLVVLLATPYPAAPASADAPMQRQPAAA